MKDITKLPYVKRRIVVIAPKNKKELEKTRVEWERVKEIGVVAVPWAIRLLSPTTFLVGFALREMFKKETKKELLDTNEEGDSAKENFGGIIALDTKSAVDQLKFPPGHPIPDHAYVGHPLVPEKYIPSSAFHSTLFEEKVNELVTLLASLGATRVKATFRKGYKRLYGAEAGIHSPIDGVGVDAHASNEKIINQSAIFEEHFRPSEEIVIPDNLIWLGHESSWQSLADRRIRFGTTRLQVSLKYEDDYGINAKMKAGLEGIGFKLGGNFSNFASTVWEFEAEFS